MWSHRRRAEYTAHSAVAVPAPGPGDDLSAARVTGPEPRRVLNGLSDVRAFFHTNKVPLYFISPTPFNLLGIDWSKAFRL